MWSEEKITHKKEYFRNQRKNPTGNFTEFVVRTYYCIYKKCSTHINNCCLSIDVNNHKIRYNIYEGFGEPDHEYNGVINDCKKHLIEMGYISTENLNGDDVIFIRSPLDFINTDEHKYYLEKYNITVSPEYRGISNIYISEITNLHELYTDLKSNAYQLKTYISDVNCTFCDGKYALKNGKFGPFFGCNNYPKCKSTKSVADITYSMFREKGINIYEIERPCWKCKKHIKLRSYFPQIDLLSFSPLLADMIDLSIIRLSFIDSLDIYLTEKYETIYKQFSKLANFEYIANNCPYCGGLQGSKLSLDIMYTYLFDSLMKQTIADNIAFSLPVNETYIPKNLWEEVVSAVLQAQNT